MARKPSGPPPKSAKRTAPVPAKAAVAGGAIAQSQARPPEVKKRSPNLVQFALQVREEARKISWTSWKETWLTSIMVFIMVLFVAVFFLVVDQVLGAGTQQLLRFAS
jgi:preprotein translocase subunit SecE